MANSTVFPIYLRAEYRESMGLKAFVSDAQRSAQAAKRELAGVGAALDAALSRPRSAAGSLDLGLNELREAAQRQQQLAAAAREVAEATRRAATANGGFDASLSQSTRSAFAFAAAQERSSAEMLQQVALLDRVQAELNQTASATNALAVANQRSAMVGGQQRQGLQQLSFQLNDVATQFALGASAVQIFAAQSGQVIQAVQLMSGGTSRFAAFLGGPWGLAITSAAIVAAPFIAKLLEGADAGEKLSEGLDKAKFASDGMASAQTILGSIIDLNTGRMREQTGAAVTLARAQLQLAEVKARVAANEARATLRTAASRTVQTDIASAGVGSFGGTVFRSVRSPTVSAAAAQRALKGDVDGALEALKEAVDAGRTTTAIYAETATAIANLGAENENMKRFGEALKALDGDQKALGQFLKPSRTRKDSGAGARRAAAQAERLATFGETAAERITRLNEAFDESPRLIDRAAQATRELDRLISELGEKKPANFEKLIADAQAAKGEVEAALLRPFEQLRQESAQRLQIEELLAQGRDDEASALQEVFRLEQQIGTVTAEQRREVEELVRAEAQRTRELRTQQALFAAQLDVVGQVQRDLTSLLSGRGVDFFGNFRQAILDLQGQRLFESLFGDAFRQIEDQLRGATPQGRANARYAAEVERTADTTARLERAFASLAGSAENASEMMRGSGVPANDNGGFSPQMAMVQAGLNAIGRGDLLGGITVTANRPVEIARVSIAELAKRIGDGIGTGIAGQLEDALGPRFAALLGNVLGGYIAGKALGGTTGGILGGLQGLTANVKGLERVTSAFGKAGAGAAVGTQVSAFANLLGIKGSSTGAQLGGALGSVLPIPGGSIIGAIAGSILGAIFRRTPRASATIGGLGDSLGVTGLTGTSRQLRDSANGLAGSVLDSVNRIAAQLGATVNAGVGRVSIGSRDGKLMVDPSGSGQTKTKRGAIDFGEDAQAAVAFAVRDLIQDGVISGLKASENRLLQAARDVESGLQDVLTFRGVLDRLKAIKDPIGAAIDQVKREFDRYRELFRRAGADASELASLEELAGIERAKAIEDATNRVVGSLKGLLSDLRIGDMGLSLRDRQTNALTKYNALAARVAAGDASAFDDFAEISRQLLDIERQLFGSTQAYFDRLAQITKLSEGAIARQTGGTGGSGSAVADQVAVVRSIDVQTNTLASRLDTLNANFIALATRLDRSGGDYDGRGELLSAQRIANF